MDTVGGCVGAFIALALIIILFASFGPFGAIVIILLGLILIAVSAR